ncbi:MAG TPA: SDR family oxidoreductase [Candidatus Lokiarchaeia archaeon]|nr:SDR family oxidoreductase [Candidatus Lokiarchaeia archaeon]
MKIKNFDGLKCLITGAASGIGRSTALKMGELGANLYLTDRNASGLIETCNVIKENGGTVDAFKALDISNYDEVTAFADDIHKNQGSMDIIMNIAGISIWGSVEVLEHQHWERVINVDLWGPIHVIECFLKKMILDGKKGHLVNVASAAGLFGFPWHSPYSAAKAGLVGISEVLRFDLESKGIGVTLVCPGAVETPLMNTVEIAGIDNESPEVKKVKDFFLAHAIAPEKVADLIIKSIKKNKYLVLTSLDMKALYWFKNKIPSIYNLELRHLQKLTTLVH